MTLHRIEKIFSGWVIVLLLCTGCASSSDIQTTPIPTITVIKSTQDFAQKEPVTAWYQIYDEGKENSGSDFLILPDNELLVVGGVGNFGQPDAIGGVMLLRTDPVGEVLFQEVYGGDGFDAGWDIAQAPDGGYIIAGESTSFGEGESDGYLIKIDESGEIIWEENFGGSMKEVFSTVLPVQNEGYFVVGNIVDPEDIITDPGVAGYGGFAGRSNIYLVKVGLQGEQEWVQIIKSELNTLASGGLVTQDGSFFVLGSVIKFPEPDDDLILFKFDQSGEMLWKRTWDTGNLGGYALAEDQEGNIILTGHSTTGNKTNPDLFILKVDQDGDELWFKEFGSDTLIEIGRDICVIKDGSYAVLTFKTSSLYTYESSLSILIVDTEGNMLRESEIELPYPSKGVSFLPHPAGGFVIAGSVIGDDGSFRTVLIRTDSQGYID